MPNRRRKGKTVSKSKKRNKYRNPIGKEFRPKDIPNRRYYVVATDEGWTRSTTSPRTAKMVVPTNSYKQAKKIEAKWKKFSHMKYVGIRRSKPQYSTKQYHVSVRRPSQILR